MNKQLTQILESMLQHSRVVNQEVQRLERTEQFHPTAQCFQLIESIREYAMCTLQTARSLERKLYRQKSQAAQQAIIFTIENDGDVDRGDA